jgi:hypothetical protein
VGPLSGQVGLGPTLLGQPLFPGRLDGARDEPVFGLFCPIRGRRITSM